jgi:hypothetical protein
VSALFDSITKANAGLSGRVQGIEYGIVNNIDDPLAVGRVQCLDTSKGKSSTDWLVRLMPFNFLSPPLPRVGDVVLIAYINGDPHNGLYLGVVQNTLNYPQGDGNNLILDIGSTRVSFEPSGAIAVTGVNSVTINGKEVLTIGSVDTRGDANNTKGWT